MFWSQARRAHSLRARRILLATGTTERPMSIPGWTLPGVMTVGAAQIGLKTGGLMPAGNDLDRRSGSADGTLRRAGDPRGRTPGRHSGFKRAVRPAARVAISSSRHQRYSQGHWLAAGNPLGSRADHSRQRSARRRRQRVAADISSAAGSGTLEPADTLLLHNGVIPSIQITRALGCAHVWDEHQRCWRPETDAWGDTTVPGVIVAGDAAGVGGASGGLSGQIAALGCAHALGSIDTATRDREAARCGRVTARALRHGRSSIRCSRRARSILTMTY